MKTFLPLLLFSFFPFIVQAGCDTCIMDGNRFFLNPVSFGFHGVFRDIGKIDAELTKAGYIPVKELSTPHFEVELYHRSGFMASFSYGGTGKAMDTALQEKGHYNFITNIQFTQGDLSAGFNILPMKYIDRISLMPKVGIYWNRLKVSTLNYDGDSLFFNEVYGNEPLETKMIRRWESGVQFGLKWAFSPLRKMGLLGLYTFSVEGGIQHRANIFGKRYYDNGVENIMMPEERTNNFYLKINVDFARGLIGFR